MALRVGGPFRIAVSADAAAAAAYAPARAVERAWVPILAAWASSRAIVFVCAVLAQVSGFPRASWRPGFGRHPFEVLILWDSHWYRQIASGGYLLVQGHHSDPAFFPLMSVLLRGVHALGLSLPLASILLANLGMLAGVFALYELARILLPEPDARRAAIYAAIFPYSFIFSMGYPEGLALATMAWAGILAYRGRWTACTLLVAASTLLRPEGAVVILPVAAVAWQRTRDASVLERGRAATAVLAAPAAVLSFMLYLWHVTGDPLAWTRAEHTWSRSFTTGGVANSFWHLLNGAGSGWLWRDAAFWLVYLVAFVAAGRAGVPAAWIASGAAICLLPLTSGSFESAARYGVLALPVYLGLAVLGRRQRLDRLLRVACPVLLAAGTFAIVLHAP